jgi:cytoskeletal protein CcmA (bactofilin family)
MKSFKGSGEESGQGRISRGVEVSGDVRFSGTLQVDGKLIGTVISESGSVIIEQAGDVQAKVDVGVCIIRGAFRGNLNARARVEVGRTARVQGDISTPVLIVEEGALFSGKITMGNEITRLPGEIRPGGGDQLSKGKGAP